MSDIRKEFETDAKPYGYDLSLDNCGCCTYKQPSTENRWKGWQAATEQRQKRIAELEAKLEEARVVWNDVDEYARNHKSIKLGDSVSAKALELMSR